MEPTGKGSHIAPIVTQIKAMKDRFGQGLQMDSLLAMAPKQYISEPLQTMVIEEMGDLSMIFHRSVSMAIFGSFPAISGKGGGTGRCCQSEVRTFCQKLLYFAQQRDHWLASGWTWTLPKTCRMKNWLSAINNHINHIVKGRIPALPACQNQKGTLFEVAASTGTVFQRIQ